MRTNGEPLFVWQLRTKLVVRRGFSASSTLVQPDSQTAGFADYALTVGPLGHLVLLWQPSPLREVDVVFQAVLSHLRVHRRAVGDKADDVMHADV